MACLTADCALCRRSDERLVHAFAHYHLVRVPDLQFPGYYRLIWNAHVAEWSDLSADEQATMMAAVTAVERVLRDCLAPTKVNLASLGNVVPHLHWHVIARFDWDSHFPQPIWAPPLRTVEPPAVERLGMTLAALDARMVRALSDLGG